MYYQDNYNTFGQQTEDEEEQKKRQYSRYGTGWWNRTAEFLATNPLARGAGFVMQGIANSGLNPAGYIARAAGMDTQPLQAQNATERMLEKGAQYGYDGAALLATGNLANGVGYFGQGSNLAGNVAKAAFTGNVATGAGTAVGGGMAEGLFNPQSDWGKFVANTVGATATGGIAGGLTPQMQVVKGGLENALNNPRVYNTVSAGTQADANVAARVREQAEALQQKMYTDLQSAVQRFPGHDLNVNNAVSNQQRNFDNFMQNNASKEVLDFAPTREQFAKLRPNSTFNPNINLSREEADTLLRKRSEAQKIGIYNDEASYLPNAVDNRLGIYHILGEARNPYIRTLNHTLQHPDIRFSSEGRDFIAKMYNNTSNNKNFMDYIIIENGKIVTKYPTTTNHIYNQINKSAQDMSLSGKFLPGYDGATYTHLPDKTHLPPMQNVSLQGNIPLGSEGTRPPYGTNNNIIQQREVVNEKNIQLSSNEEHILNKIEGAQDMSLAPISGVMTTTDAIPNTDNIPLQPVVVNRNLPHISDLYRGLTSEQSRLLDEAFIQAGYYDPYNKSTNITPDINHVLNNAQQIGILQNMSVDEIRNRLLQIKSERFRNVLPQTDLKPREYANIVQQQADNLGVKIAEGNPDKINSGVMHFVLDENGKISNRAPFVGTLNETYVNPDITIIQGNDKNYIGLLNNTLLGRQEIDNLVTRNNELYSKYQIRLKQLANKIKRSETDNLSISQNILNDMGISPSLEYTDNVALQKGVVNRSLLNVSDKKLGTLDSLASVQKVLRQQAAAEQNPQIKSDLAAADKRLTETLPSDYVKQMQSLDKAQSLKNSYEAGLNFNPDYMDFKALNLTSARDKYAFLQGQISRILLNSSDNPELLAMVDKNTEIMRQTLRKRLFEENLKYIRRNQSMQNRLDILRGMAEQKQVRPYGIFNRGKINAANAYLNDNYIITKPRGWQSSVKGAASAEIRQHIIERTEK